MRRKLLPLLMVFYCSYSQSQFTFEIKSGPLTKINGIELTNAFIGGLNSPQFTEFDLNRDGRNDLIVFERSDNKIFPFIRTQKNTFVYAPEYIDQIPEGRNFYISRDLNSDGLNDIFTSSETGDLLIYMNKTLSTDEKMKFETPGPWYYRNQNDSNFAILYNPLSFSNATTDLIGIEDMDGDGDLDIINYDQFNLTYMMFKDVRSEKKWSKDTFEFQNMDYCFGYFWEGFGGAVKLNNCPFNLNFPLKLKPRHVGGASCWFFDENNDGDKEMFLANLDSKKITKLTNGKYDFKHQYDTMIAYDTAYLGGKSFDGYMFPAGYVIDVDGDGLKDMIIAPNASNESKEKNQVHYYRNTGTLNQAKFEFQSDNFLAEQMIDLGANSSPAFLDEDGDGDLDLFVLNNGDFQSSQGIKDRISHFENIGNKDNPVFNLKNDDFLKLTDSSFVGSSLAVGDLDNDGIKDILIGTLPGKLYFYKKIDNQWTLISNQLLEYQPVKGETSWAPAVFDYNEDGINDLLIGVYNGNSLLFKGLSSSGLPKFEWISSTAWGMKSNLWLTNSSEPAFSSFGYASPAIADIDGDGKMEVVMGGYENTLRVYRINGHEPTDSLIANENILFTVANEKDTLSYFAGGKLKPALGNISGDSIPELILGNIRGGLVYGTHIYSSKNSIEKNEIDLLQINIYPNPISKGKNIIIDNPVENVSWVVNVFDVNGKSKGRQMINAHERGILVKTDQLASGVYLLDLSDINSQKRISRKIIVLD